MNLIIDLDKQPDDLDFPEYAVLCLIVEDVDKALDAQCLLELKSLEDKLYIKFYYNNDGEPHIELRKKATDLFVIDTEIDFDAFWDKYHEITTKPKTDREAAHKHWRRLKPKERILAFNNIENYKDSVGDIRYIKKARTYLADKNFYDEFETETNDWTKNHV